MTRFYAVNDRPVAVVPTADGGADCVVFDFATGEMVPDRSYFEYLIPGSGKDVDVLTEAGFEALLAVYRAEAAVQAITRVRRWAEQLCATAGPAPQVAAALGLAGWTERGDIAVDPPPRGYARCRVRTLLGTAAALSLWPAGRLLTREVFDTAFGAGQDLPWAPERQVRDVVYRITVAGAPAACRIFAGFERPGVPAAQIMLRRDNLG